LSSAVGSLSRLSLRSRDNYRNRVNCASRKKESSRSSSRAFSFSRAVRGGLTSLAPALRQSAWTACPSCRASICKRRVVFAPSLAARFEKLSFGHAPARRAGESRSADVDQAVERDIDYCNRPHANYAKIRRRTIDRRRRGTLDPAPRSYARRRDRRKRGIDFGPHCIASPGISAMLINGDVSISVAGCWPALQEIAVTHTRGEIRPGTRA